MKTQTPTRARKSAKEPSPIIGDRFVTPGGLTLRKPPASKAALKEYLERAKEDERRRVYEKAIQDARDQDELEAQRVDLCMLWAEKFPGQYRSNGRKGPREDEDFSGPDQMKYLVKKERIRFSMIRMDGDTRVWSTLLSNLSKRGIILHPSKKIGYKPSNISQEAKDLARATYAQRMVNLKARDSVLADKILAFVEIYEKFPARFEEHHFADGTVDGLAPVTAARKIANRSHIVSKKMLTLFGIRDLQGAGNILLEDVGVNQARSDELIFSRVKDGVAYYNVVDPDKVSYHIAALHGAPIRLPEELREVHIAAINLNNDLEDFARLSKSPEHELWEAMAGRTAEEPVEHASEQHQQENDVDF